MEKKKSIKIDHDLWYQAKIKAAKDKTTVQEVVNRALAKSLKESK